MLFARKLTLSAATACFALALSASPALAHTAHHHHPQHHAHHARAAKTGTIVRIAQEHLFRLGYYMGKIDGRMGKQTKAAIKRFQSEHQLKADGVLNSQTNDALARADAPTVSRQIPPMHQIIISPEVPVGETNSDYVPSLNGGQRSIASRFARVDVTEKGLGTDKIYLVTLNGQPILTASGQRSIIGMSTTYDLGNEDAIVFTTYNAGDSVCAYRSHVLALNGTNSTLLDVGNCTRAYQAQVNGGSLYITFPERDDNRAVGATWRVEGLTAERL